MGDQHQRGRSRALGHGDFFHQANHPRLVEKRVQIAEYVEIGQRIVPDSPQRGLRGTAFALVQHLTAESEAPQALGDGPQIEPGRSRDGQAGQGLQHAPLVP